MTPWSERRDLFPKVDATSIHLRADVDADGIDFSGRGLIVYPGVKARLTRPLFAKGGGKLLTVQAGADVTVIDGVFDGGGMSRLVAALVTCDGGRLTLLRTQHRNAPRLHLDQAGGALVLQGCDFGAFGLAAQAGDHLEMVFVRGGRFDAEGTMFDGAAGAAFVVPRTMTGVLMFKPQAGPIQASLNGCTIRGTKALGMAYPIQAAGTDKGDCDLIIKACAIERGASGVVGPTEINGGKLRVADAGGNAEPGPALSLTWPRVA